MRYAALFFAIMFSYFALYSWAEGGRPYRTASFASIATILYIVFLNIHSAI